MRFGVSSRTHIGCRSQWCWRRTYSWSNSLHNNPLDTKAFSKTLFLPKTTFPLRADLPRSDVALRTKTCEELYRWQVSLTHLKAQLHQLILPFYTVEERQRSHFCAT